MGGTGERITQCSTAILTTTKTIPAQVDGEPCRLAPSKIKITRLNQVPVLQKVKVSPSTRQDVDVLLLQHAKLHVSSELFESKQAQSAHLAALQLIREVNVIYVSRSTYEDYKRQSQKLAEIGYSAGSASLTEPAVSAQNRGKVSLDSEADLEQARETISRHLQQNRGGMRKKSDVAAWYFVVVKMAVEH